LVTVGGSAIGLGRAAGRRRYCPDVKPAQRGGS